MPGWLLLIHQIPPRPAYLRTKVGRRLAQLGAVAVKNSVYVLPASAQALEDFQWIRREVVEGGGDGVVVEARFLEGLTDHEVEGLFRRARDADYGEVADELRALGRTIKRRKKIDHGLRVETGAALERARRRLAELAGIDFVAASGREVTDGRLREIERRLSPRGGGAARDVAPLDPAQHRGRTWVTRKGIHVDRMASAWLIRRFIDPEARFRFVPGKTHEPVDGELRFDMSDAEFTHEGDRCSFEVLIERFGLAEAGLVPIAEIVHDIDLKDGKYGRADTEGVARVIAAIALGADSDEERLARGSALFEDLLRLFGRERRGS
jgi:hypothetical protein